MIFYCIIDQVGNVMRRLVQPYLGFPWCLAALCDPRLERLEHDAIRQRFLESEECPGCQDKGFTARLRKGFATPAILLKTEFRNLMMHLSYQKVINVEVEDNFARAASMRAVARGRAATFASHCAKHILAETKSDHVEQALRREKPDGWMDGDLAPDINVGVWAPGTVANGWPTLVNAEAGLRVTHPSANVDGAAAALLPVAEPQPLPGPGSARHTLARLASFGDVRSAEAADAAPALSHSSSFGSSGSGASQKAKRTNGWWLYFGQRFKNGVRGPGESPEQFRKRIWADALACFKELILVYSDHI
jgi:hypothetical protein